MKQSSVVMAGSYSCNEGVPLVITCSLAAKFAATMAMSAVRHLDQHAGITIWPQQFVSIKSGNSSGYMLQFGSNEAKLYILAVDREHERDLCDNESIANQDAMS